MIRTYQAYGVVLASDYPFVSPLPPAEAPADVVFSCGPEAPGEVDWEQADIVDAQGLRDSGEPDFVFARFPDRDVVRITGAADFHLWTNRIACHLIDGRHRYLVEIALFGMVLALWLEQRGVPTIHASAAVINGRAAAFLGVRGGGKTSTVAACLHAGHALLTDDLLALEEQKGTFVGRPGYPMLRLWPEQARRFLGSADELPTIHPDHDKRRARVGPGGIGTFVGHPVPLGCLYLPERHEERTGGIEVVRLKPREAVMALVRHSFLPREVQRFGLQAARLAFFARMLGTVPVARLRYPSGYSRLPAVVAALAADLGR